LSFPITPRETYNNQGSFSKLTLSTMTGAFRWITGMSKPSAYSIKTPTGALSSVRAKKSNLRFDRHSNFGVSAMRSLSLDSARGPDCGGLVIKDFARRAQMARGRPTNIDSEIFL
jgi:hypothetical protein